MQQQPSELWCRLVIQRAIAALEMIKSNGIDLLGEHFEDFPRELLDWINWGYRLRVVDYYKDQKISTEIYDAIQSVFIDYDLLVTSTFVFLPVENTTGGNTFEPIEIKCEGLILLSFGVRLT